MFQGQHATGHIENFLKSNGKHKGVNSSVIKIHLRNNLVSIGVHDLHPHKLCNGKKKKKTTWMVWFGLVGACSAFGAEF